MTKLTRKLTDIDVRLPISQNLSLSSPPETQALSPVLEKHVLRQALKTAYSISDYAAEYPSDDFSPPKQLVSDDNINMVTALMQSLQPKNAVEAALAVQFTSTYTQGIKYLQLGQLRWAMPLLAFSQTTLDSLHRYRNKGMQQINVQYNVNQGQVVNIRNLKTNRNKSRRD